MLLYPIFFLQDSDSFYQFLKFEGAEHIIGLCVRPNDELRVGRVNPLGDGFVGLKITLANYLVSRLLSFVWLNYDLIGIR